VLRPVRRVQSDGGHRITLTLRSYTLLMDAMLRVRLRSCLCDHVLSERLYHMPIASSLSVSCLCGHCACADKGCKAASPATLAVEVVDQMAKVCVLVALLSSLSQSACVVLTVLSELARHIC
jgi:hypothetical protein